MHEDNHEVTQDLAAVRSSILNGDLPWANEEVFDQWVEHFASEVAETVNETLRYEIEEQPGLARVATITAIRQSAANLEQP